MRVATATKQTLLSINPNYISIYYCPVDRSGRTVEKESINRPPKQNKPKRFPSIKTQRKAKKAVNWLIELANDKKVFNPKTKSYFNFKVNFITLTLPSLQFHTDTTIKKKLLDPLLSNLRNNYQVNNYIWRAEAQANGNIHFHILTDTFIHHYNLRRIWNNQLRKLGYISRYQEKFSRLDFIGYCKEVDPDSKIDKEILRKRFEYGVKTKWSDPNTTDIHSIMNVKNVAGYVSKYIAKGESKKGKDGRFELKDRRIEGRKIGISEKLSRIKGLKEELTNEIEQIINYSIDHLKAKVINDTYYSIICISFKELKEKFNRFVEEVKEKIREEVGYSSGGISKAILEL